MLAPYFCRIRAAHANPRPPQAVASGAAAFHGHHRHRLRTRDPVRVRPAQTQSEARLGLQELYGALRKLNILMCVVTLLLLGTTGGSLPNCNVNVNVLNGAHSGAPAGSPICCGLELAIWRAGWAGLTLRLRNK